LYLIQDTDAAREIVSWETGSLRDYTWESKDFYFTKHHVFTAGLVVGDFTEGSVTLNLYIDDTLTFTKAVSSEDVFRVSSPARGNKFKITLTGKATVDRVILGASILP